MKKIFTMCLALLALLSIGLATPSITLVGLPAHITLDSEGNATLSVTGSNVDIDREGGSLTDPGWDFDNDGTIDVAGEIGTHKYTVARKETVNYVANISGTIYNAVNKADVIINTKPTASFIMRVDGQEVLDAGTVNQGQVVEITATIGDGDAWNTEDEIPDNYPKWNFGNYDGWVMVYPVFNTRGETTVTLTVKDNYNAETQVSKTLNINGLPNANAGNDLVVEDNNGFTLDGSGSSDPENDALTYEWTYTDEGQLKSESGKTPDVSALSETKTYVFTLTVTDAHGAEDTDTVEVRVNEKPTANAGETSRIVGINQIVTFDGGDSTDDTTIANYEWNFGDGSNVDTGETLTHSFGTKGTYTVQLKVTDEDGSEDTDTVRIIVIEGPVASVVADKTQVYVSESVSFDASQSTGDSLTYGWNFGDTKTATGETVTHSYTTAGTYTATLTITESHGGGIEITDTETVTITVLAYPVAEIGFDTRSTIVNANVAFDATTGSTGYGTLSYSWDMGDGTTRLGSIPTHKYTAEGTYTVILTVTDANGKTDTDSATINVLEGGSLPVANAGPDQELEVDEDIHFQGTGTDEDGTIVSYAWNFGDTVTSTEQNIFHKYDTIGTYTVTLTVTDNDGLEHTDSATIKVKGSTDDITKFIELEEERIQGSKLLEIEIETDDADSVRVYVDGKSYTLDEEGTSGIYSGEIKAPSSTGTYELEIKVTKGDEEETKTATLEVDNDEPEIDEIDPEDDDEVDEEEQVLRVEINEAGECRYSEDNEDFSDMSKMDSNSGKTVFEEDFDIEEGEELKFYILCVDEVGNEMGDPEKIVISYPESGAGDDDDSTTPTTTQTGFFSENVAGLQIAIVFILVIAIIVIVGLYFWKQQEEE